MTVFRLDTAPLTRTQRLDNGWMRTPAHLTRVGVFDYRLGNGKIRREYRPADEVLKADSLASFDGVPLTDNHPPDGLNGKNSKGLAVGTVSKVRADGNLVAAELLITDSDAVTKVENGKRELSCGYFCDTDETPGVWTDEHGMPHPYDAVQRNIRGNHVAIVTQGRAGPDARVRLDAADGERVDEALAIYAVGDQVKLRGDLWGSDPRRVKGSISEVRTDVPGFVGPVYSILFEGESKPSGTWDWPYWYPGSLLELVPMKDTTTERKQDSMTTRKLTLDGVAVELPETAAQLVEKIQTAHAAALDKATARADGLDAQVKTMTAELSTLKDPARFDAAVTARVELLDKARKVLPGFTGTKLVKDGKDEKPVPMPSREIKAAVLAKLSPGLNLDGKSDAYVDARFDHAIEVEEAKNPATEAAQKVIDGKGGGGEHGGPKRNDNAGSGDYEKNFEDHLFRDRTKDKS